jgi:hypothetical protein
MSGAIPPLPQYAFMAWCLVKAQGQLYLLPFTLHIMQLKNCKEAGFLADNPRFARPSISELARETVVSKVCCRPGNSVPFVSGAT